MSFEFWDTAISLRFLIPFLVVLGGFLPIGYSLWQTYEAGLQEERDAQNQNES